jgi:hypothetical protein
VNSHRHSELASCLCGARDSESWRVPPKSPSCFSSPSALAVLCSCTRRGHFAPPDLGPIGANMLANPRDFLVTVCPQTPYGVALLHAVLGAGGLAIASVLPAGPGAAVTVTLR